MFAARNSFSISSSVTGRQVRIAFSPSCLSSAHVGLAQATKARDGLVVTHPARMVASARYSAELRLPSAEWATDGQAAGVTTRPGPKGRPPPEGYGGSPRGISLLANTCHRAASPARPPTSPPGDP